MVHAICATGVPEERFVVRHREAPRPFADVRAAVRWQLERDGVVDTEQLPNCTFDDASLWSHRRDGAARGSLAAVIALAVP